MPWCYDPGTMTRNEHHHPEEDTDPFWHLDEQLTELSLKERASGPDVYTVRLKAHTETSPYTPQHTIYPLKRSGTQVEITGKAYILIPDVTLTVRLFDHPVPSGALGTVRDSAWEGMRHHEIAKARGLYYEEDQALALWALDSFDRLDEETHTRLRVAFESWLLERFPKAQRIFTDDDEPGDNPTANQVFLRSQGYDQILPRVFVREVAS